MAIHMIADLFWQIVPNINNVGSILKVVAALLAVGLVKWYSKGVANTSERQMHSKVVMITGGTSGIGAATALALAQRGAQIILLVHQSPKDIFLVDYIEDLREKSGNEMIYAEQVDLSSLYSIRQFATKWIDNAPPRRLDMIILCAATLTPPGKPRILTEEGLEETWLNPPDRDVRIIFANCSSYIRSPPVDDGSIAMKKKEWSPAMSYARSKLALTIFGHAFQKHLDAYKRPDGAPMNARVIFVDPGYSRTPGMRRWFTRGTLWGLGVYLVLWQNVWLLLKSSEGGSQSFLYAAMEATLGRGAGGKMIKECQELNFVRSDVKDEKVAKRLWEGSEKLIERVEREEAVKRALEKKEQEKANMSQKPKEHDTEKSEATGSSAESKKLKSRRQKRAAK
ncbi:hypothetical protein BKA61DRAFT_685144 [Leptodontidium sp. MPI-SDFR-AT-0119]|nr:hypothetical protein BKA61DRAFT_685144 [Leptodontidium sp. MPI-SDFR-AT-0119]